jgi:hypothetical protein
MKRNHGTGTGIAVLLLVAMFIVTGCDTGTNGGGGLSQAKKEVAKAAALEEYSNDADGFVDFVAGMNGLKGWDLPSNPNTWSDSQWEQYYSFIAENQNGNGGENTGWPSNAVLAEYGLSGMTAPTGAANIQWYEATVGGHSLTINFTGSSVTDSPINTWFTSNGWTLDEDVSNDSLRIYSKTGFVQASYFRNGTSCQIQSAKN